MKNSPVYPILFMAVLSAVFAAAVSSVAVATRDRVRAGERAQLRGHVLSAFGIAVPEDATAVDRLWQQRVENRDSEVGTYYTARTEDGGLLGYGFPFAGPGFWGPIRGVAAVTPDTDTLLGLSFVSHSETPGLGGRISEAWFREQFRGKPTRAVDPGEAPLRFVFRKPETEHEVEAITGATQTSVRLDKFFNQFLVTLRQHPALQENGSPR